MMMLVLAIPIWASESDLYLLGSANGGSWAPTGPKFTYDADAGEYYLDVYFKGNVSNNDAYDRFSLTKKIPESGSTNPWGDIWAYRLVADWDGQPVQDGSTGVHLYPTSERSADNAFSIPAGIYRITVNEAMTEMSITQYHPTVTFTPVSGTIVQPDDVVSFTSNLNDLVHAINDQEDQATYSSTDNWGVQANGNTHTITHEGITTVTGESRIGYITATGTADYEIIGDLYLLGTAMGRTSWVAAGPKFDYDPVNDEYYLDVYFKGGNEDVNSDQNYGYFSMTKVIDSGINWTTASSGSGNWSLLNGQRFGAVDNNTVVADGSTDIPLYGDRPNNAFKIYAGVYRIKVNKAMTSMSIQEIPLSLSFDPPSGTVVINTVVHVTNTLQDIVHGIADRYGITEDDAQTKSRINGSTTWYTGPNGGYNVPLNQTGQIILDSEAWIGKIVVPGTAVYTVLGYYNIQRVCSPADAGSINLTGGYQVLEGETVNFTVTTNPPYTLVDVVLSYVDANNVTQNITLTPDGNDNYSFVMPGANVTITANYYAAPLHNISTFVTPTGAATVNVPATAREGETVNFTITQNSSGTFDSYSIYAVTLTYNDSQQTTTLTSTGGVYSFVMPTEDVTITVEYRKEYTVRITGTPENGGIAMLVFPNGHTTSLAYMMVGTTVTFQVTPNTNFEIGSISTNVNNLNYTDNGDGTYSFVMPSSNVTINVTFVPVGAYQVNLVNDPAYTGSISLSGHVKTENGNYYSDEGETVVITPTPINHWELTGVDVVDADNNPVNVTDNGDGTYTLVMPASDVTVTAHYTHEPYQITTHVIPDGSGVITLLGEAADNNEYAGQTVYITVDPNTSYEISEVYYTIPSTYGSYPLTDNGDGTYSFVMPEADVNVYAKLNIFTHTFRLVEHNRDIIEGGTYIYVNKPHSRVLSRDGSGLNLTTADVAEWVDAERKKVKVYDDAAMFQTVNVVDTTYAAQSGYYGIEDEQTFKAAFLKCSDGSYIGLADNPSEPCVPELFNVTSPSDQFENLRALLRIQEGRYYWNGEQMEDRVWSYYGYIWPGLLLYNSTFIDDIYDNVMGYFGERDLVDCSPVSLYKLPQPFTVTTQCVEPAWGSVQLTGVDGNIAMDGDVVTVMPIPDSEYGCINVTVIINGTGETVDVTKNADKTYSFEMPAADVTVTVTFDRKRKLTMTFNPDDFEDGEFEYVAIDGAFVGDYDTYFEFEGVVPGDRIDFNVFIDDYYAIESVTLTNEFTDEVTVIPANEYDEVFMYYCLMPSADATITVNVVPAYKVTTIMKLDDVQVANNHNCGSVRPGHFIGDVFTRLTYFAEQDQVEVRVVQNVGYLLDHVTAVYSSDPEVSIELNLDRKIEGNHGYSATYYYSFPMPAENVTVTAYFVSNTPLRFIEFPLDSVSRAPKNGNRVVVTDELIGVWAVQGLLWVKDQARAIDFVNQPDGTVDYVRQNMKLQKHEWDQSNWVILDFSQLPGWTGSESDYIRVEDLIDHKIKAGTVSGTYRCEGEEYKAQNRIVLNAWPEAENPNDHTSLGYPGYLQDPREELTNYDYHYNHYVPSNFLYDNIGGRFGDSDVDEEGVRPGNPAYQDARMFFMNPKDQEVAQVWAVWYGQMEFYDEYTEQTITGDVFETFEPDYNNGVNVFNFDGAFYVPSWEFNRRSSDRNDYGVPTGDNLLEVNKDYLFHVAIMIHGTDPEQEEPNKAPRRGQGTQAKDGDPWTHYMVYPLDLDPDNSITTGVREINPSASTTIDSIRYYNVMGQESETPFDGINVMVIRYKDGSFISKKVLR